MTERDWAEAPPYHLVAVFPDRRALDEACRALPAVGIDPASLRIDDEEDRRASLRAEMVEESNHTLAGPGVGPIPKESARGAAVAVVVCSIVALAVFLPFAAIDFGGLAWWWRLCILAGAAVAAGGTAGFIAGGGILAKGGPATKTAALRGPVLSVPSSEDRVVDCVRRSRPLRIDLVAPHSMRVHPLETEEDREERGVIRQTLDELHKDPDDPEPWATTERDEGGR